MEAFKFHLSLQSLMSFIYYFPTIIILDFYSLKLFSFLGGYLANSLAVMTDAAHLLSDFAGFMISLFAIWLGSRKATKKMSFGWHRAGINL